MDFLLDLASLFADKIVYFLTSFKNYSKVFAGASAASESTALWLRETFELTREGRFLVCVAATKKKRVVRVCELKDDGKRKWEATRSFDVASVPEEFSQISPKTKAFWAVSFPN